MKDLEEVNMDNEDLEQMIKQEEELIFNNEGSYFKDQKTSDASAFALARVFSASSLLNDFKQSLACTSDEKMSEFMLLK